MLLLSHQILYFFNKKEPVIKLLHRFVFILLICSSFYPINIQANIQEKVLILNSENKIYNLTKFFTIYNDTTGNKTINDIKKTIFSKNRKISVNFGFTHATLWFKSIIIPKTKNNRWILEIDYPPLDNITVFLNYKKIFQGGDNYPFSQRKIKTTTYAFALPLKTNSPNKLHLKVRTTSSLQFTANIYPEKLFYETQFEKNMVKGIYIGILIVMIFYNFFIFVTVKDKTYIVYIIYVFSCLFFYFTISGLTFKYIFSDNVLFNNRALPFFVNSITFWGTLFGIIFLNIKKQNKILYNFMIFLLVIVFILMMLSLYLQYSVEIQLSAAFSLISAIFLLGSGLYSLKKGYKPAFYYVMGWLTLLIGGIILVMNKFGIVPQNFFTNNVLQIGSVIEVIFLSFSLGERINNLKEEKKRAEIKVLKNKALMSESFKRFVPEQFLDFLGKENIVDISLGDAVEKNMAIMFNDIRNFTNFSESIDLKDNFAFLNSYFKNINPVIHRNNGFIDKFIGDSIMALFPLSANNSLDAAIEIQNLLYNYNSFRKKTNRKEINIGIGINYGKIMLGTVGSEKRLSTTVIGDAVNLASRMESLTKIFKVKILISENVFNLISNNCKYFIREIDWVKVKGKTRPLKIFEVFNNDSETLIEKKLKYKKELNNILTLYRKGEFEKTLDKLKELIKHSKNDFILKLYYNRCKKLIANPPVSWNGITDFNING
jgi:adenylate cyclase